MKHFFKKYLFLLTLMGSMVQAQSFDIIPLGIYGGGEEGNLSAYLIGETDQQAYLSLDAGTLRTGINKSIENGILKENAAYFLRNFIKAYFISHGHLDHLAEIIINSPNYSKKTIYLLPSN